MIYNNLFYSGDDLDPVMILFHKSWGGYSDSVAYHNNIFYSGGKGNFVDMGNSTRNFFENNLYLGEIDRLPEDPRAIHADPSFTGSSGSYKGWKSWIGYLLREGSPAIDSGMEILGMPSEDFRGQAISGDPDIGPLEYTDQVKATVKY